MKTKEEILSYLQQHKQEFKEQYGVNQIALFGSYSRNEQTNNSDIDLAVELQGNNFQNFFLLKKHLESELDNKIDLGTFNSIRAFIKDRIQKDMIYV